MNISYSKVQLYTTCPYKYYLQYVEKWSPDKTFTPLLFGSAIDSALNYVLLRLKHHHTPVAPVAKAIFSKVMNTWSLEKNELSYFKNETPDRDDFDELDFEDKQLAVHAHLCAIGEKMIDTYITEIAPSFARIISVQTKRFIPNEAGDNLVLITDFKAELLDGRVVTFDNKTSSDIKKYYGPSSVKKSTQLAIYTEFEPSRLAGYIALQKKLVDGAIKWNMVVDEIQETQAETAFNEIDGALHGIKSGEFPKNVLSCYSFGRQCEFWGLCKKGSTRGLIKGYRP